MKFIELTQGKRAIVDDEDYELIASRKWYAAKAGRGYFYAVREEGGRRVSMHRAIAGYPGKVVDHINGDTLDNRRSNLRAVSNAENVQNVTKPPRAKSGERYVFAVPSGYYVRVVRFGERHYGGFHKTISDACIARGSLLARLEAENAELRSRAA